MGFSFYLNSTGSVLNVWPVNLYQQYIYRITTRNIWQYQKECVEADLDNVYVPALGACNFSNVEFDTVLNFDRSGRIVPGRALTENGNTGAAGGIAILGDSHAMGWGVNDDETFANVLQTQTDKPVFNLAVSSYGTRREIRRLIQSPLLERVDTIVIQYCDNDLSENRARIDFEAEARGFETTLENSMEPSARTVSNHLAAILNTHALERTLTLPLRPLRTQFRKLLGRKGKNFAPHLDALGSVLSDYKTVLAEKRIIIFYSNAHGNRFEDFGQSVLEGMDNVTFVDLDIARDKYFVLDDHLNVEGHNYVGTELAKLIE